MNTKKVESSLLDFIESHISPIPECGCWLWDEDESTQGNLYSISSYIDEIIYHIYQGRIPKNHELVHRCHVACCINPNHLTLRSITKSCVVVHENAFQNEHFYPITDPHKVS